MNHSVDCPNFKPEVFCRVFYRNATRSCGATDFLLTSQRHQCGDSSQSWGDVWKDAYMDRRTDEYGLSAPLILVPEFPCNIIISPGPWTLNCIKLCQGGAEYPQCFVVFLKMTQMDTNYLSLRRFPLIALLASTNASEPAALFHSPLTVTS